MACEKPMRILPEDDALPCGSRLYWNFGQVGETRLEIMLCASCVQKQADDEAVLEAATKPEGD